MNILRIIADNFYRKINVEKNIKDFDRILPKIIEKGLTNDEWFQLYRIMKICGKCREIVAKNLDKFDFSEFFFSLKTHYKKKYKGFFIEEFLGEKNFVEIKKFLELDLDEVKKWDNSFKFSDLREAKHCFFEKLILSLNKNDLKDKKFKKFLIVYIENNNELKNYIYRRYNDRIKNLRLIRKNIKRKIIEFIINNKKTIFIIFLMFFIALLFFIFGLSVLGQLNALIGAIVMILSLIGSTIAIYNFSVSQLKKKGKEEKDDQIAI